MSIKRDFQRIAIVNRGEPAMRLLHAVRELVAEGGPPLTTIAFYTEPDARSMFVRSADEALCLGPATYLDPRDGRRRSSYLDHDRLEKALVSSRAEAAWVGWGLRLRARRVRRALRQARGGLHRPGRRGDAQAR